jgi:uncharacterized membrane protein YbhN (UPF0104 family)
MAQHGETAHGGGTAHRGEIARGARDRKVTGGAPGADRGAGGRGGVAQQPEPDGSDAAVNESQTPAEGEPAEPVSSRGRITSRRPASAAESAAAGRESASERPAADTSALDEEMPRVRLTRRRVLAFALFIVSGVAFLYFVLPKLTGVGATLRHLEHGDAWWIGLGVAFELCSFGSYVVLFRVVFVDGSERIGWTESYQITMAGLAATRLFAAAGAGGVALTAWALRRSGMGPRTVACRMIAFMVLLYAIYLGAMVIDGVGLRTGVLPGGGSFAITIVPAIAGGVLFASAAATALVPGDLERRFGTLASGRGRRARLLSKAVAVPALTASGLRTAFALVRERDPRVLGAPAWWGFDIAVLWTMFHAFGSAPPVSVIVMAYFVGTLGNLLPLPGGLGGVEGGMIGVFAAFDVSLHLAVVSVLAYRAISFWLPTLPGGVAYFQLRRTVARWREEQDESSWGSAAAAGSGRAASALQGS